MHNFAFFDLGFMFTLFGINISVPNFRQHFKNKSNESQFIRIVAFNERTTVFFPFPVLIYGSKGGQPNMFQLFVPLLLLKDH